jgi:hypothetical protein
MITNAAQGELANVEPYTESGANHYPHAYYTALGLAARLFDLPPSVAWNAGGLLAQVALVLTLAIVLATVGRRSWLALLAPVPFVLGTFAWTAGEGWYTRLESHAVLWGAFGVLFTLNGESVALCIAGIAALALLRVYFVPASRRARVITSFVAAALIGALGNVQTYSFIAIVYFVVMTLAIWFLVSGRRWVLGAVSVALVPVVYLLGPAVSGAAGQLPTLVFGMLPAVPAVLALILKTRGFVALYFLTVAAAASPQVLATALGVLDDDPFLSYRTASNKNLGVELGPGLLGAVVLLLPLLVIVVVGLATRAPRLTAYGAGAAFTWLLLASNDVWGANAEPYRLWIDSFAIVAITVLPVFVLAMSALATRGEPADTAEGRPGGGRRRRRALAAGVIVLCTLVAAASVPDWWRFYADEESHETLSLDTPRFAALRQVAAAVPDDEGLVVVDPCIDPRLFKIDTGVRTAYYHLGMAWPEDYADVEDVLNARHRGAFDIESATAAGADWLVTDSACPAGWQNRYADRLAQEDSAEYTDGAGAGTVTLWRVRS